MPKKKTTAPNESSLRQRAEKELKDRERSDHLSEVDVKALCHELEVHQIELEMQNEMLRQAQAELAASEKKYRDLYEFAPIGYLTLNESGKILEANPAAASILETERAYLISNLFHAYLVEGSGLEFLAFCRSVMDSDVKQTAEFRLRCVGCNGQANSWILVEGRTIQDDVNQGVRMTVTDISERKRAEEALRASESEMRSLFTAMTDVILVLDADGRYLKIAPTNPSLLYRPAEGLIGRTLHDIFPQSLADKYLGYIRQALDTHQIINIEYDLSIADEITWFAGTLSPMPDGRVLLIARDITERKRAEEALRESERYLESIFEGIQEGISILDKDLNIVKANHSMRKWYSYALPLEGKKCYEAYQGRTGACDDCPSLRAMQEKSMQMSIVPYVNRSGRAGWMDLHSSPLLDDGGDVVGVIDHVRDITERKRMEEELRRSKDELEQRVQERTAELEEANKALCSSEQRLLLAQKAGGVGVYDWNPVNGEIIYTSELEKIYGMPSPSDPKQRQKSWLNCVHPEDLKHVLGRMQRLLDSTQNELGEEYRIIRPDGQERWIASRSLAIRDFDNRPLRIVGTNIDITERKQAEKELTKAKEAAEEADKIKSAFMANMSHELRTPMNSVIGFTNILLDEDLTEEQKDYVERIRNSGQALLVLIDEVLSFSKMKMGIMDLELQSFDLRNIVEESMDIVAAEAANKGLELIYAFDKNVPEAIIGDPAKIRQVLNNLLSNAVKFTKEGEVEVFVSFDPDEDKVHFAIRDTGIGISHENMGKLFQPFSQLDMSLSRGYEGMGMGLAICKNLVDLMEGRIWVESEAGVGSTFQFTIPAETVPCENKPFLGGSFRNKRALIVEGSQILNRILDCQLRAWDIVPKMASSMQEAVDLLQRDNDIHVAIIDISRDDTVSIVAESLNICEKLPLIALITPGQKVPSDLFQAVLVKPLKPSKLLRALQDILEKRKASEPIEIPETEKGYRPLRILLAEDNLSNQKVTLKMLEKLGYRADAVVNGQEVLESLERQPYDIIFMDVKMPVMNGIEATRKIRERWPESGPKIIAVTAYALHGDKEKCLAVGMDGYIPKPVQKKDLAKVLGKYSIGA